MVLDLKELEEIEAAESVAISINPVNGRIAYEGPESAVDRAIARTADRRDELAAALRQRQGLPDEPIVMREVAVAIPSLAEQRERYVAWTMTKSGYFQRTPEELDLMWAQLREGDLVHPDFAKSITVERDGQF